VKLIRMLLSDYLKLRPVTRTCWSSELACSYAFVNKQLAL